MINMNGLFFLQKYQLLNTLCVAGLCSMIACSWYAYRVVQDFYDPFYGGMK